MTQEKKSHYHLRTFSTLKFAIGRIKTFILIHQTAKSQVGKKKAPCQSVLNAAFVR